MEFNQIFASKGSTPLRRPGGMTGLSRWPRGSEPGGCSNLVAAPAPRRRIWPTGRVSRWSPSISATDFGSCDQDLCASKPQLRKTGPPDRRPRPIRPVRSCVRQRHPPPSGSASRRRVARPPIPLAPPAGALPLSSPISSIPIARSSSARVSAGGSPNSNRMRWRSPPASCVGRFRWPAGGTWR